MKSTVPSRGEKPPLRSNSKSQSCLSVRAIAGSFSASAASSACRGWSRARRSLLTVRLHNSKITESWLQFSAMWRVCHDCGLKDWTVGTGAAKTKGASRSIGELIWEKRKVVIVHLFWTISEGHFRLRQGLQEMTCSVRLREFTPAPPYSKLV